MYDRVITSVKTIEREINTFSIIIGLLQGFASISVRFSYKWVY